MRDVSGAYLTNEYQQTNIKDIYAIGDCATTFLRPLIEVVLIFLFPNALRTAYIATQHINNQDFTPSGSPIYKWLFYI